MRLLLGLGGNLGDVAEAFRTALVSGADGWSVLAVSGLWTSRPVGPAQPDFTNAAAVVATDSPLDSVLAQAQRLEREAGRVPGERWGPRPLDLDLLLAPGVVRVGVRLVLPHPRFHLRPFALGPAAELVGDWVHPLVGRTVADLAAEALAADPAAATPVGPWW